MKIKLSPSKKNYMKGRGIYEYIRGHMPIPKRLLVQLELYFGEDFKAEITEDSCKIALTYVFFKKPKEKSETSTA